MTHTRENPGPNVPVLSKGPAAGTRHTGNIAPIFRLFLVFAVAIFAAAIGTGLPSQPIVTAQDSTEGSQASEPESATPEALPAPALEAAPDPAPGPSQDTTPVPNAGPASCTRQSVTVSPSTVAAGQQINWTAQGFLPGSTVAIVINPLTPNTVVQAPAVVSDRCQTSGIIQFGQVRDSMLFHVVGQAFPDGSRLNAVAYLTAGGGATLPMPNRPIGTVPDAVRTLLPTPVVRR